MPTTKLELVEEESSSRVELRSLEIIGGWTVILACVLEFSMEIHFSDRRCVKLIVRILSNTEKKIILVVVKEGGLFLSLRFDSMSVSWRDASGRPRHVRCWW